MKQRNRLPRAALVLALLMLAATVTGVAASATKTAIPAKLTGKWKRGDGVQMIVSRRGTVEIDPGRFLADGQAKFSHVTAHRLSIGLRSNCAGTGTYSWNLARGQLKLTKIQDACPTRVGRFAGTWRRTS